VSLVIATSGTAAALYAASKIINKVRATAKEYIAPAHDVR
jgi:hypothetical protein